MKFPILKVIPATLTTILVKSVEPSAASTKGIIMSETIEFTIDVKADAITTPIAISNTLPLAIKSRNSSNTMILPLITQILLLTYLITSAQGMQEKVVLLRRIS